MSNKSSLNLLLINLKKSLELTFLSPFDDEIFLSLQNSLKAILVHGINTDSIDDSYRNLANDLNWLQATTTLQQHKQQQKISNEALLINHTKTKECCNDFLSLWILRSLQNHTICSSLQLFYNDKELLLHYYHNYSFLCQEKYSNALFIILSAYELNQSSLLSQIDSDLLHEIQMITPQHHRRSSSHPQFSIIPSTNIEMTPNATCSVINTTKELSKATAVTKKCLKKFNQRKISNKNWKSLPNIRESMQEQRPRSKTISQPISIPCRLSTRKNVANDIFNRISIKESSNQNSSSFVINSNYNPIKEKGNDSPRVRNYNDIKIYLDQSFETPPNNSVSSSSHKTDSFKNQSPINNFLTSLFSTTPKFSSDSDQGGGLASSVPSDSFLKSWKGDVWGEKITKPNLNFDDLILAQSNSSGDFLMVGNEQTLPAFLKSNPFSRNTAADLERENAHFKISEAIISIVESIKWSKKNEKQLEKNKNNENDKQLIENVVEKSTKKFSNEKLKSNKIKNKKKEKIKVPILDEGIEPGTSYLDDSHDSTIVVAEEADVYEAQAQVPENELTAYAEWGQALSAESVGLSLISKFSDRQLPKVSELKWLVSEEDAPQQLLPIPLNDSANPDDHVVHSITIGTRDWAPPRKQIIFTDHPQISSDVCRKPCLVYNMWFAVGITNSLCQSLFKKRKQLMQKQNYRCAGCSMKVAPMYMNRYRYCVYFGKYFCTGCHRNHLSEIPAKILNRWDFTLYSISVLAYRLLEQVWTYPLFPIKDLAPILYSRVKSLGIAKYRRIQLKYIKDFIVTCRFVESEHKIFDDIPSYLTSDVDRLSMSDFLEIKNGKFRNKIEKYIKEGERHVLSCVLCSARGFICELCKEDVVIFPWQSKVKRCDKCGTCFHLSCWNTKIAEVCIKCQRLNKRDQIK